MSFIYLTLALLLAAASAACTPLPAIQQPALAAPNLVTISSRLVTAGQPSLQGLENLGAQGFEAVIFLTPASVPDSAREEASIVGRQGISFINIPIKMDAPTEQDFEIFSLTFGPLSKHKVLVHCQKNLSASSMVFLYRAIVAKEDPKIAYEAVATVWSPNYDWKNFMLDLLRKHGVNFEPY